MGDDHPTHPRCSADHDSVTSTEVGVYGKRSWCGFTVSQTSPTTLSREPLELRSPGMPPPPPCSLPLWSALELPMRTSLAEETVRDAWNQTEACSNPVIKILHWMLILWKKPNDFTACLISESDEKPKSIQQNGPTLYTMWAAGRKVHQCGGAAGEKKIWSVMLQNASLESDLCLKAVLSVETLRTERRCDNSLYQRLKLCQPLSFVRSTLWRSAGVLVFQQRQCRGNNQPALSHCRPYAGQTQQPCHSINTEGKKRCSIVLQRPMGCLGIMTPCLSESSFLWPMNEHWWSSRTGCGYRFFTHKCPPFTKEPGGTPGA